MASHHQQQHHQAVDRDRAAGLKNDASAVLLARGRCYEQLEDLHRAREDFRSAVRVAPDGPHRLAASDATRRVTALINQDMRQRARVRHAAAARGGIGSQQQQGLPTLPRPTLPQFELRGKAGAAF